jgi:CHAD domain-containing protein/CYTH domain-containing protein
MKEDEHTPSAKEGSPGKGSDRFDRPVFEVAAAMARDHLAAARTALDRMNDRRDTEALHDFRVAIRRLRSVLRAYRPWLGPAAGRRLRRRFGDLAATTGNGRDAEVQVAWLEAQRSSLSRSERCGLQWTLKRRRSVGRAARVRTRSRGRDDFEALSSKLTERLDKSFDPAPPLGSVFPKLLRDHADAVQASLRAIGSASDRPAAHEGRIRTKRLRYLLDPFQGESGAVRPLIRPLKRLQDVLGELHDLHVLEAQLLEDLETASHEKAHRLRELAIAGDAAALRRERRRDERLGLAALAARARTQRDEFFAKLEREWLGGGAAAVLDAVRSFAASFAPAEKEHGLPVERERKFLLADLPSVVAGAPVREIEQGWLPGKALHERLRHVRSAEGEAWYRTVKLGSGIERIEIEEETTPEVFAVMWPLTEGCRIRKRRYEVRAGDLVWEIDQFLDRDLVLAEVELETVDQNVPLPEWLLPVLACEVTGDPAYLNLTLATRASSGPRSPQSSAD